MYQVSTLFSLFVHFAWLRFDMRMWRQRDKEESVGGLTEKVNFRCKIEGECNDFICILRWNCTWEDEIFSFGDHPKFRDQI